jgi:lysophospholipase L1-like esterase
MVRSIDDPPIPGYTLFAGSSSFTLWKEIETVFSQYDAVNRAFGGSQYPHNIAALERIHLPGHPSRVVVFCGTNDVASGTDPETAFKNFKYYIARFWNENPLIGIYILSPSHAPIREKYWQQYDEFFNKVKELSAKTKGLFPVDTVTPMNGESGKVREDLFLQDRLHPNEECYKIWTDIIRESLNKQDRDRTKIDLRALFRNRKELGLFNDPRFAEWGITVNEPPVADFRWNIVFIGDSITIGGGEKSPPNRCAEYLKQQPYIEHIAFSNQGVSGATTVDFLPSQGKLFPKVVEAANKFKDDPSSGLIFSLMLGTNDSAVSGTNGSPVSLENYRKNIKEIADKLLKDYPGSKIILHRPIWYSETTQNSSVYLLEGQLRVTAYALELESLIRFYSLTSAKNRVFLGDEKAYHYFKTHHESTMRHETGAKGTFYLHPDDRGADILGRFWGAAILDAVR